MRRSLESRGTSITHRPITGACCVESTASRAFVRAAFGQHRVIREPVSLGGFTKEKSVPGNFVRNTRLSLTEQYVDKAEPSKRSQAPSFGRQADARAKRKGAQHWWSVRALQSPLATSHSAGPSRYWDDRNESFLGR